MTREFQRGHKARISDLTRGTDLYVGVQIAGPGLTFDISCFGLDADERLSDDRYFVFYNQPKSPEEAIQLLGPQAGDTESFRVTLDRIPPHIRKLTFTATIDGAGQMAQIGPGYLRIAAGGQEMARYSFTGSEFSTERAVMLGDIYYKDGWRFAAVGQGFDGGLEALLKNFGGEVLEEEDSGSPTDGVPGFAPPAEDDAPPPFAIPSGPSTPAAPSAPAPAAAAGPAQATPATTGAAPVGGFQPAAPQETPPAPPNPASPVAPSPAPAAAPAPAAPAPSMYAAPTVAAPVPPAGDTATPPSPAPAPAVHDPQAHPQPSFGGAPHAPAPAPSAPPPPGYGQPTPPPGPGLQPPFGQVPVAGGPGAPQAAVPQGVPQGTAQGVPDSTPQGAGVTVTLQKYKETPTGQRWTLQNSKLVRVDLGTDGQPVLAKQGSMVLYQGKVDFAYKGAGVMGRIVGNVTGQEMQLMRCTGQGQVFLADDATHLHPVELQGDAICVSADNVLAFDESLHHEVRRIEGHGIPGGALFTLQFQGTGTVVVKTHGTPVVLPVTPTTFVDSNAVVAWSAAAQVIVSSQVHMRRNAYPGHTGEGVNLQFRAAPGNFVVVQPYEV
ncbi:hypothetical protein GCM10010512_36850 [Streptomyces thermoviolaceus subsp. thermoviolaceus]|uniref:Stress protein n=2 Tax=Streptomyces TaxID=1883 RepID=A0ABX0YSR0_STRTL|nr:TerD family protein [Streptomyces thermoviolaceus]NJP15138.1 stress protein [Streptomyces thermoviolaceus subsp. thermoviolaceus]GHB02092.1 hypothetical protein GCM10010512_36850 [Streptomyces thermoviolaceus subsp. thermoviolaceus]